jgi:Leucine-rich repeat (LRR) protein
MTTVVATDSALARPVSGSGRSDQDGARSGPSSKGAAAKRYPARQFNSRLPFSVKADVEGDGRTRHIGKTPADRPLEIPACEGWWVVAREITNETVAEIEAQSIPGLQLPSRAKDAGLAFLKGLTGLRILSLDDTKVTDGGLKHLKGLKGLQSLDLAHTRVTDVGLTHVRGLTGLRSLYLFNTKVTDAGLKHLRALTRLQKLSLGGTKVTDAGLAHLRSLSRLRTLHL